jgi:hypothetical protein
MKGRNPRSRKPRSKVRSRKPRSKVRSRKPRSRKPRSKVRSRKPRSKVGSKSTKIININNRPSYKNRSDYTDKQWRDFQNYEMVFQGSNGKKYRKFFENRRSALDALDVLWKKGTKIYHFWSLDY